MVKIKIIDNKRSVEFFPRLMVSSVNKGLIVGFTDHGKGVVVCPGASSYAFGYLANNWRMDLFSDFDKRLTISNNYEGEEK